MADEVKLSVCVITYNQARYIAQAIDSALLQQVDFALEIVVGEDCSTDQTRAILQDLQARHPARIRLLLQDRNVGMMANFEAVFADCRGQYIAMLEGDDYWTDPHKLQKQVDALDAHSDWTVCFHRVRCVHEDGSQPDFVFPRTPPGEVLSIDDILRRNFIQTCSVVYRRVIDELPAWLTVLKLGDWPLHILHADRGKIGFLPEQMAVYRIHRDSNWSSQDNISRYRSVLEMLTAVDEHFAGRYRPQVEAARLELISDLLTLRSSADYRLGSTLLAPVRQGLAAIHWLRRRVGR
jgi:glycosyltransferase involved in cell wall biosynthesis